VADGGDTFVDKIVGSAYATDGVVNLWRAIEGDDDVVEEGSDLFCTFVEEKTCRQEGEVNLPVAKEVAESGKVVV
jgi:hypothetical protein